mmetsp:Transcript_40818/g.82326  ORF Transcript_40818/g.82326 Transcript_40818/m.82326 type:complete len:141 (+) Transcript_40818:23-445(+)
MWLLSSFKRAFASPLASIVCAAGGSSLFEMYDFQVYGYLAKYIATAYFPAEADPSSNAALLAAFGTYSAAFVMRPLGGIYFGRVGDAAAGSGGGRKAALVQSTALMAVPSLLMGLLPTYSRWGAWSTALLVAMRCIQVAL